VDLASLLGRHGGVGGEVGGAGPLGAEACRRLACDGALTRVLVTRHPTTHHGDPDHDHSGHGPGGHHRPDHHHPDDHPGHDPTNHYHPDDHPGQDGQAGGLVARLRAAATLLPPVLGGSPSQPLEVGRASRVVSAAQRAALVVRDGGCAVTGCDRPPPWCEAHHLRHWLDGGRTDLANLALVCRAHHRAVHEGGWRLVRDGDGRLGAIPPHRRQPTAA
jgi:HNH endonuclease